MDKEKFGIYLQKQRKKCGLTQAELAQKIHVTDKAISKWERGIGLPDITNIEPLADALNISIVDIMHQQEIQTDKEEDPAENAIKNTLDLAKQQKKSFRLKVLSLLFLYIAIKAVYGIFFDTSIPSNYNNLPMVVVYTLLIIYIIFSFLFALKVFHKNNHP